MDPHPSPALRPTEHVGHLAVDVVQVGAGAAPGPHADHVVVERPLVVRVRGLQDGAQVLATTMRTPGDDHALAVGLCLSEGLISGVTDLVDVQRCPDASPQEADDTVLVTVDRPVLELGHLHRHGVMTSACGLCGRTLLDDVASRARVSPVSRPLDEQVLLGLPARLAGAQAVFGRTGGLHAVACFDLDGHLLDVLEDVGRHNAFDKLVGRAVRQGGLPLHDAVVLLSGRASYELLAKAAVAGAPVVASIGAPSSMAVDIARRCGITLVGFLRDGRGNVYAGAEALTGAEVLEPAR